MEITINDRLEIRCRRFSGPETFECNNFKHWDEACTDCPVWALIQAAKGGTVVPPSLYEVKRA